MKKFPISLLCGIAAIVLAVILFFAILGNVVLQAIHFLSLIAVIVAIAQTTIYAMLAKGDPSRVAAAVISSVMIPAAVALSVVYISAFPFGYGAYLLWYFSGMVVVNGIALVLIRFRAHKTEENMSVQAAKENMQYLCKQIRIILTEDHAQAYADRLSAVEETLRFSNDAVIVPEDTQISGLLDRLRSSVAEGAEDTQELLSALEKTAKQRVIAAK